MRNRTRRSARQGSRRGSGQPHDAGPMECGDRRQPHGVFCVRASGRPYDRVRQRRVIVNISSISRAGNAGQTNYSARSGVESMVSSGRRAGAYGIRWVRSPRIHAHRNLGCHASRGLEQTHGAGAVEAPGSAGRNRAGVQFIFENDFFTGAARHRRRSKALRIPREASQIRLLAQITRVTERTKDHPSDRRPAARARQAEPRHHQRLHRFGLVFIHGAGLRRPHRDARASAPARAPGPSAPVVGPGPGAERSDRGMRCHAPIRAATFAPSARHGVRRRTRGADVVGIAAKALPRALVIYRYRSCTEDAGVDCGIFILRAGWRATNCAPHSRRSPFLVTVL